MAVSDFTAASLKLGKAVQIAFAAGMELQLSDDAREFEMVKSMRQDGPLGRSQNYMVQTGFGPAAVQYRNPTTAAFPASQKVTTQEASFTYKELDVSIEIDWSVWKRAMQNPDLRYFEPIAIEVDSKRIAASRRVAADFAGGDGTGIIAQVASVSNGSGSATDIAANGQIIVTLKATNTAFGCVGMLEQDDLVLVKSTAAAAHSPSGGTLSGTFYAYRVVSKSRTPVTAPTVTLQMVDSSDAAITVTGGTEVHNIVDTDVIYRVGQPSFVDVSTTVADYSTASDVILGLESLAPFDGRTVCNLAHTGALAATSKDVGGSTIITTSHVRECLDNLKLNVGRGRYAWKQCLAAPETIGVFIDANETDRRFMTIFDQERGIQKFVYVHGDDSVELVPSEFIKFKRMYIMPESKSGGNKVFQAWMNDFESVRAPNGDEFMLKPSSSGGHERKVVNYLEGVFQVICKHPRAVGVVHNFIHS